MGGEKKSLNFFFLKADFFFLIKNSPPPQKNATLLLAISLRQEKKFNMKQTFHLFSIHLKKIKRCVWSRDYLVLKRAENKQENGFFSYQT